MRKKFFKYIKFIFCTAIILSLVAPSFAASSVVDSSAFITKDEFDKALLNFEKRLVSFESGINSKIDNQVSTYLDRNSIWNGVSQPWLIDTGSRQNIVIGRSSGWFESTKTTPDNLQVQAKHHMEVLIFNKKIAKATKEGLCSLVWGYKAGNGTSKNRNRLYLSADNAYAAAMYLEAGVGNSNFTESVIYYTGSWSLIERNQVSMNNILWCTLIGVVGGNNNKNCMGYGNGSMFTSHFFVSKDDDIWARWRLFADAGNSNITLDHPESSLYNDTESNRPEVVFQSCNVY